MGVPGVDALQSTAPIRLLLVRLPLISINRLRFFDVFHSYITKNVFSIKKIKKPLSVTRDVNICKYITLLLDLLENTI